jgi:hypothetical protein
MIALNSSFAALASFNSSQLLNSGRETPRLSNEQHSLLELHPLSFEISG